MKVEKLELKHIAPYLPYGLKVSYKDIDNPIEIQSLLDIQEYEDIKIRANHKDGEHIWMFKPYLRPLDQLTQEITHGEETFIMMDRLFELEWPSKPKENSPYYYNDVPNFINVHHHNSAANTKILKNQMLSNPYWMIQELLKYHFDVFNLLSSGLAIPILNTK